MALSPKGGATLTQSRPPHAVGIDAVIVVGGDERAVRRLGFRPATTLTDALEMAIVPLCAQYLLHAKRGNEPVQAWVLIPISFRLEG